MAHGQRFYLDEFGQFHDLEHEPTITRNIDAEMDARHAQIQRERIETLEAQVKALQEAIVKLDARLSWHIRHGA